MKIVFVTEIEPFPPLGGECLRVFNLLKALRRFSEIHLVVLDYGCSYERHPVDGCVAEVIDSIDYINIPKIAGSGLLERLRPRQDVLEQLAKIGDVIKPDVAWLEYSYIAHYAKAFPNCKVIFDTHNVQSNLDLQIARLPRLNLFKTVYSHLVWRASKYHEQKYFPQCDALLAVSEPDLEYYRQTLALKELHVVPNFIELSSYIEQDAPLADRARPHSYPCLVFTGSMDAFQNRQAGTYLLEKIWPKVLQDCPDCKLLIVGKNPPQRWRDANYTNVQITGTVPSTVTFIRDADVAIVPVLHGSGTRYKILEAMACHTPVVSTSLGCQGIDVQNDVNIMIEDKADKLAKRVVELLRNPDKRSSLGACGYQLVTQNYSMDSISLTLHNLIKRLLDGSTIELVKSDC